MRLQKKKSRRQTLRRTLTYGSEQLEDRRLLAFDAVVINELMAHASDGVGWVELRNTGEDTIDLSVGALTNEIEFFQLPQVSLGPDEYIVLSSLDFGDALLEDEGGYLALVDQLADTVVNEVNYPAQLSNVSYGLIDLEFHYLAFPTPGATNNEMILDVSEFVSLGGDARLSVPLDGSLGNAWTQLDFDDSVWQNVSTPVGYSIERPGEAEIATDVAEQMFDVNSSAYFRFGFAVDDPSAFAKLVLRVSYDDGFAAFLNGQRITGSNAPDTLLWDSPATGQHDDTRAEEFDVTDALDLLMPGENVLAVQGLNLSQFDDDFLISVGLIGHEEIPEVPTVTVELPTDSQGRHLIGDRSGVIATVSVEGTDPAVIDLNQLGPGQLLFGPNDDSSLVVTTHGGPNNTVEVLVRANPERLSDSVGDSMIVGSIDGHTAFRLLFTAYKLSITPFRTIVNDAVGSLILQTTPVIPELIVDISDFAFGRRQTDKPDGPQSVTTRSVEILGGSETTDAEGLATIDIRSGVAGQTTDLVGEFETSTGAGGDFDLFIANRDECGTCCCESDGNDGTAMGSVHLYAGEKILGLTDLSIRGRGFDFSFSRTYRSQASHLRSIATNDFGVDWAFSYSDDRLLQDGDNVIVYRPDLRTDMFVAGPNPGEYKAPMEFYEQLNKTNSEFELRESGGMVRTYKDFTDPEIPGRLVRMEDRNGNFMTFHYEQIDPDSDIAGDDKFVLAYVVDTLGREIRYQYYARSVQFQAGRQVTFVHPANNAAAWGRLARVVDFKGDMDFDGNATSSDFAGQVNNRTLTFDYDDEGNLITATSPIVDGTPNHNNFLDGKTTRYQYIRDADIPPAITGIDRQRLQHNLKSIQAPNEVADGIPGANPREELTYHEDPPDPASFDRVHTYAIGGINNTGVPAGGANALGTGDPINYKYEIVNANASTTNDSFLKTTVTDRRGNVTEYEFSPFETLITKREFTRGFRPTDPTAFVTDYLYNDDKETVQTKSPLGNTTDSTFDQDKEDRFQNGNLISSTDVPDSRGGDQSEIMSRRVFEPIYQQLAATVDPRGLDPDFSDPSADPSGRSRADRYTTRYFFDYQEADPAFVLPLLAMELGTTEGIVQQRLDAAGIHLGLGDLNADGDVSPQISGNIVREVLPSPVLIDGSNQHRLEADIEAAGDLIEQVAAGDSPADAGEGIHRDRLQTIVTLYQYNQFGQITKTISPEGNVTTFEYYPENDPDGDGQLTPSGRPLIDGTGGYLHRQVDDNDRNYFDENGSPSTGAFSNNNQNPTVTEISNSYLYDDVGNIIRVTNGRGIRTDYVVNELDQVVQTTRSADISATASADPPEPLALTAFAYLSRTFYDHNNNVVHRQIEDRGNTSGVFDLLPGDANGDGEFNSSDLVDTFQAGKYERGIDATWQEGDWNRDGRFDSSDLVAAFQANANGQGIYETGPYATTAFVDYEYRFDILDNLIESSKEVIGGFEPEILITRFRYDANENQVLTILPEGNATTAIFDDRDLPYRTTRGATLPAELDPMSPAAISKTLLAPNDPTDYDVRGGIRCQCTTYHYDENQNVIETVDAADTDGSPDNNSDIGGPGDRTRYIYDGFDRLTSVIDSVGNQTVYQYDPAGNRVRTLQFGPVGGASFESDGPDTLSFPVSSLGIVQSQNLVNDKLLAATEENHDEINRLTQTDHVLFVNTISTIRPPDVRDGAIDLGKGDLTPGDDHPIRGVNGVTILGRVSNRTEYDRNSRITFRIEDDLDTFQTFYDGADHTIKTIDSEDNSLEYAYDDNHNVIEIREEDVAQNSSIPSEEFFTTNFYDSLDRLQRTVDNLGQTMFYRYDSRDNMVAMADAQGPLTGATIERRAFDACTVPACKNQTVNSINDFGNVTRYFYDGISRQTRQEIILTESAEGDGINSGATIEGVTILNSGDSTGGNTPTTLKDADQRWNSDEWVGRTVTITSGVGAGQSRRIISNTATELTVDRPWNTIPGSEYSISTISVPDESQAGGDGIIRVGTTYDKNSLTSAMLDDQGNVTAYLYDNLNRQTTETKGLTVNTSPLNKDKILGSREVVTPTVVTINDPAVISAAKIDTQLASVKARIDALASLFPALADRVDDNPPTTIVSGYDPEGNVLILEDENDNETFSKFDAINRRICARVFRAGRSDSHMDEPCRFAPVNDPSNPTDPANPPVVVGTTRQDFEHDGLSRMTRATDNNDPSEVSDDSVITYAYDSISRIIEENQQIGSLSAKTISSAWRAESLRSGLTHPNGRQLFYTYDGLDRLNLISDDLAQGTSSGGNAPNTFNDTSQTFTDDELAGDVIAIIAGTGGGQLRRIVSNTATELTVASDWDVVPDVSSQYIIGVLADYDYIGINRLLVRNQPNNGTRMTFVDPSGATDVGYDGLRRVVQLRHIRSDNSLIVGFTYAYDRMNNKLTEEKLHDSTNSEVYTYDSAYRLVSFERPDANSIDPLHDNWILDGAGNWKQVDGETRQHSSFNEILERWDGVATEVRSDDNGNVLDNGTFTFQWDSHNRLRTVTRKADGLLVAVYIYDPTGRRIRKDVTNSGDLDGTTNFYYDAWQVIEERDHDDTVTQQYTYGRYIDEALVLSRNLDGDNIAIGAGDHQLYYHQNSIYSVYVITEDDAIIVEGYVYDAYGKRTLITPGDGGVVEFGSDDIILPDGISRIENPYGLTGRRLDDETGMYYYRSRYLNSNTGRFTSRDTIGIWGDATNNGNGYSLGSNPMNYLDPMGTFRSKAMCVTDCLATAYAWLAGGISGLVGALGGHAGMSRVIASASMRNPPSRPQREETGISMRPFGIISRNRAPLDKMRLLPFEGTASKRQLTRRDAT